MEGQSLVARLKLEHPNATILEILEMSRKIHIKRAAEYVEKGNYESPVHIIEDLARSGTTCEDLVEIFSILELNSWPPQVIQSVYKYIVSTGTTDSSGNCHPWWSCLRKPRRTSNTKRTDQK